MSKLKKWLFTVAVKKIIKRSVQLLLAFISAEKIAEYGVTIDATQLTIGTYAAFEVLRNYLKVERGINWL